MALAPEDVARLYAAPGLERYRPEAVLAHCLDGDAVVSALCYNLPEAPDSSERNTEYAAELRGVLEALEFPRHYVIVWKTDGRCWPWRCYFRAGHRSR